MTEDCCTVLEVFWRPQLGLVGRFAPLSGLWGEVGLNVRIVLVVGLGVDRG